MLEELDLYAEQEALEKQMRADGVKAFLKQELRLFDRGVASQAPIGNYGVAVYISVLSKTIREYVHDVGSGKPRVMASVHKWLTMLDPDVLALLTLKGVMNMMLPRTLGTTTRWPSETAVRHHIGSRVHDELRAQNYRRLYKEKFNKITEDVNARDLTREKRLKQLQVAYSAVPLEWDIMGSTDVFHVGTTLLYLFMVASKGDLQVVRVSRPGKRHTIKVVVPSSDFSRILEERHESFINMCTSYMPMVIKPIPWSYDTLERGGYLTADVKPYPLVKGSTRAYKELLKNTDLHIVFTALNALQETPFAINKRVLDALEYVYELNRGLTDIPLAGMKPLPPMPEGYVRKGKDKGLTEAQQKIFKDYRYQCFLVNEENRRLVGKRMYITRLISQARQYSKYERFYLPVDMDSRGRTYYRPSYLNPQGPDTVKGILQFADGSPLASEEAVYWLAVHGANNWGFDKEHPDARAAWTRDHQEMILKIAEDPKSNLEWTDADAPYQFLAFCFEWAGYVKQGLDHVCHIHVDVDATCSGLQHFSALLRDPIGGAMVNLVPNPVRADVYQKSAEIAMDIIRADTCSDGSQHKPFWLTNGMSRSIAKRSVMIVPYSGTLHACMDYTHDALKEAFTKRGLPVPPKSHDLANYGASRLWSAIQQTVPSAISAMSYIKAVVKACIHTSDVPFLKWTTPVIGLPVWQRKVDSKVHVIRTWLDGFGRIKTDALVDTDHLSATKCSTSIPPSFIHSLDATHMLLSVYYGVANGIKNFVVVHDCFGSTPGDMELFNACIREAFVDIYEDRDVFRAFIDELMTNAGVTYESLEASGVKLPAFPEYGTLDVTQVRDSIYFFS